MPSPHPEPIAFVLERRLAHPLDTVTTTLVRDPFVAGDHLTRPTASTVLRIDAPFRRGVWSDAWRAPATLLTRRGRRICAAAVELDKWSSDATCVSLRPAARNPLGWSGSRMRRYFDAAHRAIDDVHDVLDRHAAAAEPSATPEMAGLPS
jgi:hypothetical protein